MGDPPKSLMLAAVVDVIKKEGLLDLARESGQHLMDGLQDLQVNYDFIFSCQTFDLTLLSFD